MTRLPVYQRQKISMFSPSSVPHLNASGRAQVFAAVTVLLSFAACSDPKVIAEVGSSRITRADVRLVQSMQGGATGRPANEVVDRLVRRELLAEGARQDSVVDDATRARIAAAERDILAQAYLEKRLAKAVTDETARQRYDARREQFTRRTVHVQQVFIRVPPGASEDLVKAAVLKAGIVSAQLQSGRSFGEVAREFSDDSDSATRDGELPPMSDSQVDPAFFDAAAALSRGETSPVVESPLGFHVIRALENVQREPVPFEQVRGRILADLRQEEETKLLDGLRKRFSVKVHVDRLNAGEKR